MKMSKIKQQLQDLRDRIDENLKRMEEESNNQSDGKDADNFSDDLKRSISQLTTDVQQAFNNIRAKVDPNYSDAHAKADNLGAEAKNQANKLRN